MRHSLSIIVIILLTGVGSIDASALTGFPLQPGRNYELNITLYQGTVPSDHALPSQQDLIEFKTFKLTYRIEVNEVANSQFELIATWLSLHWTQENTRLFRQDYRYTYAHEVGMHDSVRILFDSSGKIISGDPLLLDTMTRQYSASFLAKMPGQFLPFTLDLFNPSDASLWNTPVHSADGWQRTLQQTTANNLFPNQRLLIRFDYQFQPRPVQALSLNIEEPTENCRILIAQKDPFQEGVEMEVKHGLLTSYPLEDPSLLFLRIFRGNKILLEKRVFAQPGDQWEITWDGSQPAVQTPYDPWNSNKLDEFWAKFRDNHLSDPSDYYLEKMNLLGETAFLEWVENQYTQEMSWIRENSAPDPIAQQLVLNDSYYTHAQYAQRALAFHPSNQNPDFQSGESVQINRPYSEGLMAYDQYLEVLANQKLKTSYSTFNPLNNRPSFGPLTGFYYAIENLQDYPRDYLLYKYARIVISNTLFDLSTSQHVLQLFQDLVPDTNQNAVLIELLAKRKSLEKGQYFSSLMVSTPSGPKNIQDVISGPLLIFHSYRDYSINPDLILNLDGKSLQGFRIVILTKLKTPELARIISDHSGIPIDQIFVLQPAEVETILDTLFIADQDKESSIFTLLLDEHQKIYYAGPNRFAPLYRGLQEYKLDLEARKTRLRQKVITYTAIGLFLILVVVLIIRLRERHLLRVNAKKYQQLNLKWQALTGQLNPHFLFNSLASIREMINQNRTEQAANFIQTFSNFLRNILKANRSNRISLEQEIEFSKNYLELEQMRFPFQVQWNIDPDLDLSSIEIPPLLLQPYLENAIKHGIGGQQNGLITLNFAKKNQLVHITITDNGQGLPAEMHPGSVGMALGKERLDTYYAQRASIHFDKAYPAKERNQGTMIELWLPIE